MAVIIPMNEVWDFFNENVEELANVHMLLAEDTTDDIEVYITEENGRPFFTVEVEGKKEHEAKAYGKISAEEVYRQILTFYEIPDEDDAGEEPVEEGSFDQDDLDRLDELKSAVEDLFFIMTNVKPEDLGIEDDQVFDLLGVIEEYLWDHWEISTHHPTIIEDEETGERKVVQFPFDEFEYVTDDESDS